MHVQSENGVHVATVDKFFFKTQNKHRQRLNEKKSFFSLCLWQFHIDWVTHRGEKSLPGMD